MKKQIKKFNSNFLQDINKKISNVIIVLEAPSAFVDDYEGENKYDYNSSILIKNKNDDKNRNDYIVYLNLYKCGLAIENIEKSTIRALGRVALMEADKEINPINELLKGWQLIEKLNLKPQISKSKFFDEIKYQLIENSSSKKLNIIL